MVQAKYDESDGLIATVGRWPWKLASAKKRVTTYLPNQAFEKMEGRIFAYEGHLAMSSKRAAPFCRRICVSGCGGAACADLGSSNRNVFVLDEGFSCGGVNRLCIRRRFWTSVFAAVEATQARRMAGACVQDSRTAQASAVDCHDEKQCGCARPFR